MWKPRKSEGCTVGETTQCNEIHTTGLRAGSYQEIGKEYFEFCSAPEVAASSMAWSSI